MAQAVIKGKPDDLPIASRIKMARKEAEVTIEAIAQQMGVSSRTVAGWQSGRSRPSYERLVELAELLGKSPSYFLEAAA